MSEAKAESVQKQLRLLRLDLERNVRYHEIRRSFFHRINQIIKLSVILLGSAAAATFVSGAAEGAGKWVGLLIGLLTSILGAIDLTIGPGARERDHDYLKKQYNKLLSEAIRSGGNIDINTYNDLESRHVSLMDDEPPYYKVVNAIARNDVIISHGLSKIKLTPVNRIQRIFMNVSHFKAVNFKK